MPPSSFRDYIEEVRDAADIVEVIGESVQLKRAGRRLVGLCPFHREKTPSFQVDPERGVFHCFGCRAGGTVFDFVMQLHGLEFKEAATLLGDRLGIQRPRAGSPEGARQESRRKSVLEALEQAHRAYRERLEGQDGVEARRYLQSRGLDAEARGRFELGLAPAGWDFLLTRLTGHGFDVELLEQAGLASRSEDGRRVYDRFRNRVTFPIRDSAGRVVSFGGRALDDNPAKYLNGPETQVFDKGRALFRLFETSREIRDSGQAVLVEGYFDALSLSMAGVPGVVAVCGTALGPRHAQLLSRWCRRVVLFLDGDRAGREAARRSLSVLLKAGLGVRVALAGEGLDPDDLARRHGAEAVTAALSGSLEFPDFLAREASGMYDLASVDGRVAACQWVLEHLVLLPNALARAEAADRVADALGIRDDVMRAELARSARSQKRRLARSPAADDGRSGAAGSLELRPAEACLVRYAVDAATGGRHGADEAAAVLEAVPREALTPWSRKVLAACEDGFRGDTPATLDRICGHLSAEEGQQLLRLAFAVEEPPTGDEARAAVAALRVKLLEARLQDIQSRIVETEDQEEQERLLKEKLVTRREMQALDADASAAGSRATTGGE